LPYSQLNQPVTSLVGDLASDFAGCSPHQPLLDRAEWLPLTQHPKFVKHKTLGLLLVWCCIPIQPQFWQ